MNPFWGKDMIESVYAIKKLLELYRKRLEENPPLMARDWTRFMDQKARLEYYDDDWVLLIDEMNNSETQE